MARYSIKEYREKLGLSQAQFADRLGISKQQVSNWENKVRIPSTSSLWKIGDEYGVEFLGVPSKRRIYLIDDFPSNLDSNDDTNE